MSLKKAASLILCHLEPKPTILLLKRSSYGYYGNLRVFPGGKLTESDNDEGWLDYITSNSNLLPSQVGQICASRESFEEINLLLTTKSFNSKVDLKEWRQKVTNQPEEFINLYRHLNTKIPIDRLCYYSNWISPLHFKENRFDTQFFMTVVNDDERNACVPDGREIVDLEWSSPIDIITRFENGEIQLMPPQYIMIKEMIGIKDFQLHLKERKSKIINPITPEVINKFSDGHLMALPGDTLHSTSVGSGVFNRLEVTGSSIKWIRDLSKL